MKEEVYEEEPINIIQIARNFDINVPDLAFELKQELDYVMSYGNNCPDNLGIKIHKSRNMDEKMKDKDQMKQSSSFEDVNNCIEDDVYPCIQSCPLYPHDEMNHFHSIQDLELVKNIFSKEISEHKSDTVDRIVYITGEICFPDRGDKTRLQLYEVQRSEDVKDQSVMALEYSITEDNYNVALHNGDDSSMSQDELCLSGRLTRQIVNGTNHKMYSIKQSFDKEPGVVEKPYRSDDCDVGLSEKEGLNILKKKYTGERNYKCDECGADFTRSGTLKTHIRIHTGEKPYKCDVCGAEFSRSGSLKTHKRIHTGEKPYSCEDCGIVFSHKSTLAIHRKIHTGERSNRCDVCGVDFTHSSALKEHKRRHTGEKPFKCDICGVDFARSGAVKTHRRIHTGEKPYKCDVCGVHFARVGTLKIHNRIHTGEKPYGCDICGVSFSHKSSLKTHSRVHTGENANKCDICGVCFSDRMAMKIHKRMHRKKK